MEGFRAGEDQVRAGAGTGETRLDASSWKMTWADTQAGGDEAWIRSEAEGIRQREVQQAETIEYGG